MCRLWTAEFRRDRIGKNKILSRDEIMRVMDEFASVGMHEIAFLGGEPFLRKELIALIRHCRSRKVRSFTVSNGYLIGEEMADRIVRSGLDLLAVSIDGPRSDIHDRIRGVSGAFDHAVQAITLIKKRQKELNAGLPDIGIACTVSSNNFLNLPDMIDLAKRLNVGTVRYQYISVIGKSTVEQTNRMMGEKVVGVHNFVGIPPEYLVPEEHIDRLEGVMEEVKARAGTRVECGIDPVFLPGNRRYLKKGIFPVHDCNVPWSQAFMTPTGDFIPCPMFTDYKMGNIRDSSFKEIWNSKRARGIRRRLARGLPAICQKCCFVHAGTESRRKGVYRRLAGGFKRNNYFLKERETA
jgi:radical SAM protein with 4Fe4S-binding SPASM domain